MSALGPTSLQGFDEYRELTFSWLLLPINDISFLSKSWFSKQLLLLSDTKFEVESMTNALHPTGFEVDEDLSKHVNPDPSTAISETFTLPLRSLPMHITESCCPPDKTSEIRDTCTIKNLIF